MAQTEGVLPTNSVFYRLFHLPESKSMIWLYCEWDDLLPDSFDQTHAWGKPIFVSSKKKRWQDKAAELHPSRNINGVTWFQTALRKVEGSCYAIHTDRSMVTELRSLLHKEADIRYSEVIPLLGIPLKLLQEQCGDIDRCRILVQTNETLRSTIEEVAILFGVAKDFIGIGGSVLAGLARKPTSDFDLTVHLDLNKMDDFRSKILAYKRKHPDIQRDRYANLYFPYKFTLEDGICVDIFPKAINIKNHPLNSVRNWKVRGDTIRRTFTITDTVYAHEALPVFSVEGCKEYLIVLCNGFRGALLRGDVVEAECVQVELLFGNGKQTMVWSIPDPFYTISNIPYFFSDRWHKADDLFVG